MSLNRKELDILEELSREEKLTLGYLSEKYEVSERNIRYSIDNLNYYLTKFSFQEIGIKKGELNWRSSRERLEEFIQSIDIDNYIFSKEERENYILIKYLFSENTTITEIEKYLKVSRPTIKKDIISLNEYLKEFELEFVREENGINIKGKEKKLRHLKLLKLLEYLDIKDNKIIFLSKIYLTEKEELEAIKKYVGKIDTTLFYNLLFKIEKALSVKFDKQFEKLIYIYLIPTVERIEKNFIIKKKDNSEFLKNLTDYKVIKNILKEIIPEELEFEFLHLTEYFISGYYSDDFSENISLVKEFVEKFSEIISQSLNFEFYNNLEYREEILKYLLPAVYRIKNNFFLIKTERKVEINKNIYEKIREAVIVCNSIMKEPFREDEIEYLTEISEKYIKREEEGKISLAKLMELIKKNADIYDEKKLEEEIMRAFKNKIEN